MSLAFVQRAPLPCLRMVPLFSWNFAACTAYGLVAVGTAVAEDRQPLTIAVIVGLVALVGLTLAALIVAGQYVVCSFNRASDTLLIRKIGIQGTRTIMRPLSELRAIELHSARRALCQVELRFASGERIRPAPYYVLLFSTRQFDELGAALGVPVQIEQVQK